MLITNSKESMSSILESLELYKYNTRAIISDSFNLLKAFFYSNFHSNEAPFSNRLVNELAIYTNYQIKSW